MKKFMIVALAAAFGLPMFSQAAVYSYVAATGEVKTVEASTPESAIATAPDRAPHSGVALGVVNVDAIDLSYQYVDVNGNIQSVEAMSAEQALLLSGNGGDRAEHSGVVFAEADPISSDMKIPV